MNKGDVMKDLPHHIKKLNRRVIRSKHREECSEEAYRSIDEAILSHRKTEWQEKKQAKVQIRKERKQRVPAPPTVDEKNQKMKHRVPVFFDKNHQTTRTTKPTRKKTPRL